MQDNQISLSTLVIPLFCKATLPMVVQLGAINKPSRNCFLTPFLIKEGRKKVFDDIRSRKASHTSQGYCSRSSGKPIMRSL
jgi:hypothetical protein